MSGTDNSLSFLGSVLQEAVFQCYDNKEFVEQYNRLTGSNINKNKTAIESMIDEATGKTTDELRKFIEFVQEYVVTPTLLVKPDY